MTVTQAFDETCMEFLRRVLEQFDTLKSRLNAASSLEAFQETLSQVLECSQAVGEIRGRFFVAKALWDSGQSPAFIIQMTGITETDLDTLKDAYERGLLSKEYRLH